MTKLTQMTLDEDGALGRRRIHLREISGGSDAPLETVGQDLRAARLRRGDDLATVSRNLKIRKDHLGALEEDRIEDLPGKTYAIGFVRSYAQYLGLNAVELAERFKQEISGRHEEQLQHTLANLHQGDPKKLGYGWRAVAGLVILALGYGAWHLFFSDRDAPQPVPPAPALSRVVQAEPSKPAAQAPTASVAIPPPALGSAAPATAGTPANPVAAPPPAAGAKSLGAPTTPVQPGSQAAVPAVPLGNGHVYGQLNQSPRVVLRARGATHIEVRGRDGTVYINRTLDSGDSYQLPNIVGLSLNTSNGGAIEVDLDGIAMGAAGSDVQPAGNVPLDPQAIMDRYNKHT